MFIYRLWLTVISHTQKMNSFYVSTLLIKTKNTFILDFLIITSRNKLQTIRIMGQFYRLYHEILIFVHKLGIIIIELLVICSIWSLVNIWLKLFLTCTQSDSRPFKMVPNGWSRLLEKTSKLKEYEETYE